jgi:dienelactone hydrolase
LFFIPDCIDFFSTAESPFSQAGDLCSLRIPVAQVEALKAALAENKTAEFKIYPGAPHGFHADYRTSYRKDAAEDAWNQMRAWFKKYNVLS